MHGITAPNARSEARRDAARSLRHAPFASVPDREASGSRRGSHETPQMVPPTWGAGEASLVKVAFQAEGLRCRFSAKNRAATHPT
jgi:hypothetical protein